MAQASSNPTPSPINELGWRPLNLGMRYFIGDGDFEATFATGFEYLLPKMREDTKRWKKTGMCSRFRFF